jgi:hypothetical protein
MAKILISPLGTGALNLNNTAAREYRTAKYRIDERNIIKALFPQYCMNIYN